MMPDWSLRRTFYDIEDGDNILERVKNTDDYVVEATITSTESDKKLL